MKRSLSPTAMALPAPVWVVGTYGADGKANAMTVSWCGMGGSPKPALFISIRRETQTYKNILAKQQFTVNIPMASQALEVDYLGLVSGFDADKIKGANLTVITGQKVDAPCIQEFPVNFEAQVSNTMDIGVHTLIIGQIVAVSADSWVTIGGEDLIDVSKVAPLLFASGTQTYHGVTPAIANAFEIGKTLL